jgi:hypothetical protein
MWQFFGTNTVEDMVGSDTIAAHVRQHLAQKRSRVFELVVFGKHTLSSEQRSRIFLLTTGAHRDNFNAFFERRQSKRRSWFTHL